MLKPFQIRNLRESSSGDLEDVSRRPSGPHGVVRVSAADYDDIALNHPRARLTYLDEDDGDQITVGSSLELSQRLDEPLDIDTRLDNVQLSQDEMVPMHIFDIRRSNSVTELWKQFERDTDAIRSQQIITEAAVETEAAPDEHEHKEEPTSHDGTTTSAPETENQPFMAAFEAELASLLNSAENPGQRATQPEASTAAEPSSSGTSSQRAHHPLEVVAATFLYHLVNGANSVQSELRSRLPELQEQLRNAQRTVPENVRTSLQSLLATIEAHMRTAFQNLPDNGRQFAEDAINAGRPVAEHAADGFRMMASELNEASRTLFAAFENEFGRFASNGSNATSEGPHAAPGPFPSATADVTVPDLAARDTNPNPTDSGAEKEAASPDVNPHTLPSDFKKKKDMGITFILQALLITPLHSPPRPPHHPVPPMPPRHWPPPPPPPPNHPPWQMPWDPVHPIRHHPPPPLPQPPLASGIFPAPPWLPPNSWFSPVGPHSAPPAPPPKETPRGSTEPSEIPEKKVLFIGNVGFNVTERMIQDVFASKGFIVSVRLPQDSDTGQHAGFGYIDFPSIHPAMAAMDALQGVHIDGHAINLEFTDDAVIDSVHPPQRPSYTEPRTLYEAFARQNHLESGDSGVSAHQRARPRRVSRRKSVTFQEPDMSSLDVQNKDVPARLQSPPLIDSLIDLTTDDTVKSNDVQDQLPEMSRFPPVSQLEAQLFANQQQSRALEATADATAHRAANESTPSRDYDRPKSYHEAVPVHEAHGEEPSPLGGGGRRKKSGLRGPGLRRSNTMTFARRGGELSDFPNSDIQGNLSDRNSLRRRASERHSLRRDIHDPSEMDTWARLDRRERRRSRPSSYQSIPGSFPMEEVSQPAASAPIDISAETRETDIDKCVSSLVDMGYGSPEDGGQSRMAVYAAASNGNLFDAIEMIEEERKAYARQGRE
ncbi:uncharacterized protein N7496_001188 [Penicillium cataractarum]|uniref:RRM domain-containing protein n=1 Tax=Penicillium cataractarum TaxID=2100454 RepID=A0A9W9VVR8_9EURO|nr:uncharacterized protein N7496_001188 [Penicillium cataractarum]KAJ5390120.1 hypothetical protein N7496_001188 [Penicillium cataractarum]